MLPAHPVWLDVDADRIAQVVTNLLNNAARYTPPGGTVTVSISEDGDHSVLSISDTGIGLDPEDRDRVFEMFTQVGGPGSGGLGIGLALVRGIVELHGGHVEARSKGPGHGSEFRITLPAQDAPLSLEHAVESEAAAIPGTCRVLVVDDNRDSAEMMSLLLSMHGHTVRTAHDAESALTVAFDFAPQAALLDIGLPGVNGYELAQRLRNDHRTRDIRLVAVTGWGQDADRARARAAGFDAHLTKPAEPDRILAALGDAERV
jgi:CheY-like chemotaxis protein